MERVDTTFSDILDSIKARMLARGFDVGRIHLGLEPEKNNLPSNVPKLAIITPGSQRVVNNEPNTMQGTIEITLYMMTQLDQAQHLEVGLTNDSYGLFTQGGAELVSNLNLYDLTDATDTNWILARPMQLTEISEPQIDKLWTRIVYTFDILWGNSATATQLQPVDNLDVPLERIDSKPATILMAMKDQIETAISPVYIGPPTGKLPPNVTHYAVLYPGKMQLVNPEPSNITVAQDFYVHLWTFMGLEQAEWNEVQLTDSTYGIYPKVDAINSVLNWYDLLDTEDPQHILLAKPIVLDTIQTPQMDGMWARTTLVYKTLYGYRPTSTSGRAYSPAWSFAYA